MIGVAFDGAVAPVTAAPEAMDNPMLQKVMETVLQFLGGTVASLQSFTLGNKIVSAVSVFNFYAISQRTKIWDIFSQYQPHFISPGLYLLREAGEGVSYWGTYPAV